MIYTTLNQIHHSGLRKHKWVELLAHLGKTEADDEPLPLVTVLDINGPYDTIWCLRVCPDVAVEFARWCADEAFRAIEAAAAAGTIEAAAGTIEAAAATAAGIIEVANEAFWAAYRAAKSADETDADLAFWADWAAAAEVATDRQIAKLRELLS